MTIDRTDLPASACLIRWLLAARLATIFVSGLQRHLTVRAYLGLSAVIEQWELF